MLIRTLMDKANLLLKELTQASATNLVGIDVGPDSLKLLEISSSDSKKKVENFAVSTLPPGVYAKDEIKDTNAVSTILRQMIKDRGITTKSVAIAIPRSLAIIKNINVDSRLTANEIDSRAWIEANRHFPDLISDIYLDYTITGPSLTDPSQLELVLVACRKDQIKPYLEILKQSGLDAKIVDINCYALERALPLVEQSMPQNQTIALLNLNIHLSTLIVMQGNHLIHAHDQSYDGQRLLTQAREYLKNKQIPEAVVSPELMDDEGYNAILKENLIAHLRHVMHFFYSSRPNVGIQKLILAGDCATLPNLFTFMQRELGIEATVADPFTQMTFSASVNEASIRKHAPALMLCCGLALSKVT